MGAAVALGDYTTGMILEVRQRANQETTDEPNAFIRDNEIRTWLNAELAELIEVIDENEDDPYRQTLAPAIVTASGTDTYALPADFKAIVSVDVYWGTTQVRSAKRFNEWERNRYKAWPQLWGYTMPLYYRTLGQNLVIQPVPQGAVTLYVHYLPAFQPLVNKTDTFDSVNQWHEYAVWGAVAQCQRKDDDDPSYAISMQAKVADRVRNMVGKRNQAEPPHIAQTRGPWRYDE